MKKLLILLSFMMLNACVLSNDSDDDYDYGYVLVEGGVYYGLELAFIYGEEFELGSVTWTRSEEISSDTYIYTTIISATTDDDASYDDTQIEGGSTTYVPEQQDPLDENPNIPKVVSSEDISITTLYMKVKELSNGVALYGVTTSYDNAVSSSSYQLYTYYWTYEPREHTQE